MDDLLLLWPAEGQLQPILNHLPQSTSSHEHSQSPTHHHQPPLPATIANVAEAVERDSEGSSISSPSKISNHTPKMVRGSGGRGARGRGRGRGGSHGGRQMQRTNSSGSASTDSQSYLTYRPVLKRTAFGLDGATPQDTEETRERSAQINNHSPFVPSTNAPDHNNVPLSSSTNSPPTSLPTTPPPATPTNSRGRNGINAHAPTAEYQYPSWAVNQTFKIKIMGIPKSCWTKDVHKALRSTGNILSIEIRSGSRDHIAWVTFQSPLRKLLPRRITVGPSSLTWERLYSLPRTTPSPVDPSKQLIEQNLLLADSIALGIQDGDDSMVVMQTVQTVKARDEIQVKLNLERKEIDIIFPFKIDGRSHKLRFRLPISYLPPIQKVEDHDQVFFVIPFNFAPQWFVEKFEGEALISGGKHSSFSPSDPRWNEWNTWFRVTDIVDTQLSKRLRHAPVTNHKDGAMIDIGSWTTYRLGFDITTTNTPQFQAFVEALSDYGVKVQHSNYTFKDRVESELWSLLPDEVPGTRPELEMSITTRLYDLFISQIYLTFPVRYQLEVCISNGYLKEHTISKKFLLRLSETDPDLARKSLEKVAEKQEILFDPMDIFRMPIGEKGIKKRVADHFMLQRSAVITPTSVHVASPIMDISNRITRKHAADADRFIRVRFTDEKIEGILRNMPNDRAEALFEHVRRAIENGIVVAGRHYEFLAFGNSQFRESGAYFYAPTSINSADDIRGSLGEFSHIKSVSKYAARLGQCFSTTREMGLKANIVMIPDVERNGFCFTDGVGKLSRFLAQMAVQELGLSNQISDPPSVCQFRMGGCKGVLAIDCSVTGSDVHIRPSQRKFDATYKGLEFIRFSSFATPFFNRQIIIVLKGLGVPDDFFIAKQQAMLSDYELAMHDERAAIRKLRHHVDINQTTLTMAGMIIDGFMSCQEPFIMSLLHLWRASTVKGLKEKARIAIDDGAFVLGCVDETATLQGHEEEVQSKLKTRDEKLTNLPEIFLQVDDLDKPGHYKIIEGVCVLARNPSLHPGDIRVVRAVNVPALSHLKNVVVLPQTGDRDIASMCSGGDLDGDDYMVLYDRDLLETLQIINVPAMDFTADRPLDKEGDITIKDIGEFFVNYMKNDTLGTIAHAHLAQADSQDEGVHSPICLELAELHSRAVDYPKSGIPAVMRHDLKPRRFPHFMEKKHLGPNKMYKSENILGRLYDLVELIDFKPAAGSFDGRILEAYELDEDTLTKASNLKADYDKSVRQLMAKYDVKTDFEAFSVFILNHNQKGKDYKLAEDFGRTMGTLKEEHRNACRVAAKMRNTADWERLGPFVAAMYTVTARAMEQAKASEGLNEEVPLTSFPWLFASELGKIAMSSSMRTP